MKAIYPDDRDPDPNAEPGVSPEQDFDPDSASVTLEVDGELFMIRPDRYGGCGYTWLSGPNPGYGFGLSPAENVSLDQHRANIREFLADIDPATGFLPDG